MLDFFRRIVGKSPKIMELEALSEPERYINYTKLFYQVNDEPRTEIELLGAIVSTLKDQLVKDASYFAAQAIELKLGSEILEGSFNQKFVKPSSLISNHRKIQNAALQLAKEAGRSEMQINLEIRGLLLAAVKKLDRNGAQLPYFEGDVSTLKQFNPSSATEIPQP